MKKFLLGVLCTLVLVAIILQLVLFKDFNLFGLFGEKKQEEADKSSYSVTVDGVSYGIKAQGNYFYSYSSGNWDKQFIRGVNIGAGEPGIFPGELTISYEDYYRWFGYISDMNCNYIRVYTTLRPQFYNALKDFNEQSDKKLYLFQGVWMDENDISSLNDVYADNEKIKNQFTKDAKDLVDVLHGNITLPVRSGYASGSYSADVSDYVAGWIIGIEWDPKFVKNINDSHPEKNAYDGKYLYTLSASPFEAFLCDVGDQVISYETDTYHHQVPVAFSNWVTTDPLVHPNEPHSDEDMIAVNTENIKSRSSYLPGMFASYHVYPYYPDTLNYQEDYLNYKDASGKNNPYEAYLIDLKAAHTMPVLIGEFGIPSSRGMAHKSVMGYNQGNIDENQQGGMLLSLYQSIYDSKCAGGLMFTWQDEWFKRTWNNVKFDIPDRRPFWSNYQTNEQNFGILAFDPGESTKVVIDGDVADWNGVQPVIAGSYGKLYLNYDERYLYIMADLADFDFKNNTLYIPIDTIAGQGNLTAADKQLTFSSNADFLIQINGEHNSRILVDQYYDTFQFLYGEQQKLIAQVETIRTKNTGIFNPMLMCYGYEMQVPPANTTIPFQSYETGLLTYGISDPESKAYASLTDFYCKDNIVEIRIPWQLLNVMDPSTLQITDDLYKLQDIAPVQAQDFKFGMAVQKSGENISVELNGSYLWQGWSQPTYHERLKPAYQILQQGLASLN